MLYDEEKSLEAIFTKYRCEYFRNTNSERSEDIQKFSRMLVCTMKQFLKKFNAIPSDQY